jgi:flagellar hook-basal body complex protein FliE
MVATKPELSENRRSDLQRDNEVQRASLAFRAVTGVRNKLVNAYRQVMNRAV